MNGFAIVTCRIIPVLLIIACSAAFSRSFAQTQFWSDTFEDIGAPSSGIRTASIEFGNGGPPFTRYFRRTDGSDISLNNSQPYTNVQGSKYWAGEDLDGNVGGQQPNQTITWTNINISGKSGLSFKGLIAAWNGNPVSNSNSIWEGTGHPSGADFIEVQYSIDGGPFTKIIGIYCHTTGNTSGILKLDTNGDLVGDGTTLDRLFQEFTANITGTGNILSLRLNASCGSLVEEFAFDNFRLFYTSALPVKLLSFQASRASETENLLTWKTAEEINASHFEIERSLNGTVFEKTGEARALGSNSTYTYLDKNLPANAGKIYYRISMNDLDGKKEYSKIIFISTGKKGSKIDIYPSVTSGTVHVVSSGALIKKITVFNLSGQALMTTRNKNEIELSSFSSGMYIILVQTDEETRATRIYKR